MIIFYEDQEISGNVIVNEKLFIFTERKRFKNWFDRLKVLVIQLIFETPMKSLSLD